MKNLGYIRKELIKIYGKETTGKMVASAQNHYKECLTLCKNASKGEIIHLENTILPTVSFYKALLEADPQNAFQNTKVILIGLCKKGGKALNVVLKIPGMKAVFMRLLSRMAVKMFGRESGFDYENFNASGQCLKMDMTMCPYIKYARLFKTEELAPVFCESDVAVYGNLSGISFERTETLGTGGSKCDFKFLRTDR